MKSLIKKQEGFTLIEIVLVLAIAAFIILLVFTALQGANKARRDTGRKEEATQVVSEITAYEANNGGVDTGFVCSSNSACNAIKDVDTGNAPTAAASATVATSLTSGVEYSLNTTCTTASGTGTDSASGNTTQFSVEYWSETAGTNQCIQG